MSLFCFVFFFLNNSFCRGLCDPSLLTWLFIAIGVWWMLYSVIYNHVHIFSLKLLASHYTTRPLRLHLHKGQFPPCHSHACLCSHFTWCSSPEHSSHDGDFGCTHIQAILSAPGSTQQGLGLLTSVSAPICSNSIESDLLPLGAPRTG